jgi:cyclopropane fatty-acyl-phospholipid synthase-like methyltransferase
LLQITSPATILDIGSGTGNVEELIFKKLPHALVTCVEASKEMAQVSQPELAKFGDNAKLICQDILAFKPEQEYDAILASLVLHNVPYDKKEGLLRKIKAWLNPGGVFVWSDLIRYSDKQVQKHFIDYRLNFGFERGGSKEFARKNFEKEEKLDYPLTIKETLDLAARAGFKQTEIAWMHDTFAIFYMKK